MSFKSSLGVLIVVTLTFSVSHGQSNCYVRVAGSTNTDSIISSLQSRGIRVVHVLPPNEFIAVAALPSAEHLARNSTAYVRHFEERAGLIRTSRSASEGERIFDILRADKHLASEAPQPVDSTPYCGKHTLYPPEGL